MLSSVTNEDLQTILMVVGPLVTIAVLVVAWMNRERLGVSIAQNATRAARNELVDLQERRIELLETEVNRLTEQVSFLSAENSEYRRRIQRLEDERRGRANEEGNS
jgi:FtsZ-interacting cell division protein ZipA